MNYCVIVNPNAGRKQGRAVGSEVAAALDAHGSSARMLISEAPGQTREIAASIDPDEYDAVIAVGGDGTLFDVVNGLLREPDQVIPPLGLVPVGTGNSFIKDLGIDSPKDAVRAILDGRTRPIDLGEFTCGSGTFYFANLLGAGFVSNVAHRASRFKALGALSYVIGVVSEVTVLKAANVELTIDGVSHQRSAIFVEICNSRFTGGNMMMAPNALIDDGTLDVIVMSRTSRRKLLGLFPSIFRGSHVDDPIIEVFRGREISLTSSMSLALTPDGETFGETPISVRIHPGRIRMFW